MFANRFDLRFKSRSLNMIADVFRSLARRPSDAADAARIANRSANVIVNAQIDEIGLDVAVNVRVGCKRMLPDGVQRRSDCHMRLMRDAKRCKAAVDATDDLQMEIAKLGSAWNNTIGLRRGDTVLDDDDDASKGLQSGQWTITGLLRVGWMEVGHRSKRSQESNGVGETHRCVDGLVCLARIAESVIQDRLAAWIDDIPDGRSLHIRRAYDATQRRLTFGRFEDVARPYARYLIPDTEREGRYISVPWSVYHSMYPRSRPSIGIVDVLASDASLHTTREDRTKDSRNVKIKPLILSAGDAGTLNDTVDSSCFPISLTQIAALSARLHVITMSESPDACTVNDRRRAFARMILKDYKNV